MWILWTSKEQGRKTPKLGLSNNWILVSICFHDAKVVVVVKIVFATKILLLQGCSFNVFAMWKLLLQLLDYYIGYIWRTTNNVIWKTKVKFYCKASIFARLLLFWSFYYYFEMSIPLKLFIASYKLSFQGPTLQWWTCYGYHVQQQY